MTKLCLESIRNDASFTPFWQKIRVIADKYDIGESRLPRKRRAPGGLDDGMAPPEFPTSIEDHFRPTIFKPLTMLLEG